MFAFIDFVLSVVLSVKFAVFLLATVGIYAICWWLIDNLSSVVQVVRTLLQPYFQPQEDLSLCDRYGNWAGMFMENILLFFVDAFSSNLFSVE